MGHDGGGVWPAAVRLMGGEPLKPEGHGDGDAGRDVSFRDGLLRCGC